MKPAAATFVTVVVVVISLGFCSSSHEEDPSGSGCTAGGFQSAEPWGEAKYGLLRDLLYNIFSQPDSRYWTSYTAADGTTLLYGYASCAKYERCDDSAAYSCPTESNWCSGCLSYAVRFLRDACDGRIGGHVIENTGTVQCYMRFEDTQFW